jgi:4-hydroxybutyrate dehydrogenase
MAVLKEIKTFSFPTRIVFGPGALARLGDEVKRVGGKRALVVTDAGIVKAGLAARVTEALDKAGIASAVFDRVDANPIEKNVHEGVDAFRAAKADLVVAIGGGSPLDTAKLIRLKATHEQPLEFYDDLKGGDAHIRPDVAPMIAIPTTAGTGSDVGRSGVVTIAGRKVVIFSPYLIPTVALCDAELTLGLPPFITAATGMDALAHNIEAYLSKGYHPMADALALGGAGIVAKFLVRAVKNGREDIEARQEMMMAAIMGAVAFQKGLGAVHSLSHPLGSVVGMHHGLSNSIVMPAVLRFNTPAAAERMADLAVAMGEARDGRSVDALADALVDRVAKLAKEIGLPATLREAGVKEEHLERMIPLAVEDGCHPSNPRPCPRPCTADDFRTLYRAAF